jgi:adenylate kinase
MNIIFIAPPAAGKGTLSALLEDKFNYKHLSTGDLLRAEIKKKTDLGNKIEEIITRGELVSDDIITELLKNELKEISNERFILDGYPRNIAQAETLNQIFNELNIENYVTIYLELEEELAMKRALGRVVCNKCGASYNTYFTNFMPKQEGICDKCEGELIHRSDDTEETFKKRFDTYINVTNPLLDYYKELGKLEIVNANEEADKVFVEVTDILEKGAVDNS